MDVRKKLVEWLKTSFYEQYEKRGVLTAPHTATDLISHGVTVQEWIPVTERLPDTIPCGAGTEYSEAVNVLTDGRKVLTAIWNGSHWICDAEDEEITHWTPVLLPLPEPLKGE